MKTNEATTIKTNEGANDMQKNDKVMQMKRHESTENTRDRKDVTVRVLKFCEYRRDEVKYFFIGELVGVVDSCPWITIIHEGEEIKLNDVLHCTIEYAFNRKRGFHTQLIDLHKIDRINFKLIQGCRSII